MKKTTIVRPGPARLRGPFVVAGVLGILAVTGGISGCSQGEGDPCQVDSDCEGELRCVPALVLRGRCEDPDELDFGLPPDDADEGEPDGGAADEDLDAGADGDADQDADADTDGGLDAEVDGDATVEDAGE